MAQKVKAEGGKGGKSWDDGYDHDGVTKIQVAAGEDGIQYVKFDYVKNGKLKETPLRGANGRSFAAKPFVINHPEEYLVSIEGWYNPYGLIQGLNFKTNKKTSDLIGYEDGTPFTLQVQDKKIIGFHGFAGNYLHSLGAYFAPVLANSTPLNNPPKKLEAKGGKAGDVWDDGVHEGVKKIYVGQGQDGVAFVKFEYYKESQNVHVGDEHGKKTMLATEEFEIDVDDYIVSAEGTHEKVFGVSDEIITCIRFRTYKGKTSQPFGINSGTRFVLQGGKIVGFHGQAADVLHSLGAYMTLQSTLNLQGNWLKMEQKGTAPGLRCSHAIAAIGDKIYSFGGEFTPNQPIDKDLYVFDINTKTWSIAQATGDVPHLACLGVCMVSIGTTLYVFGGRDASRKYNGFYSFDTIKNEWKLLTPVETGPTPRSFHSMAADEKNVYVFGGVSATNRVKTLDVYNIVDKKWVQLPTPGDSFSVRGGAGLEVVNGKVWVVYGFTGYELDDIHYFDLAKNKWLEVETIGQKPCGRSVFASGVVGKYILVFGGEVEMDPLAHVGPGHLIDGTFALDTETLKWERLDKFEEEESPMARGWSASTTATIDGKKGMVMLGGKAQNNDRFDDLYFYEVESA